MGDAHGPSGHRLAGRLGRREEIGSGRGLVLLRGIEAPRYSKDELRQMFRGMFLYLGTTRQGGISDAQRWHLIRIWLSTPHSRPLPEGFKVLYGRGELRERSLGKTAP